MIDGIPIKIEKSNRRSISITTRTPGEINVKAPMYVSKREIIKFVESKFHLLKPQYDRLLEVSNKHSFTIGSTIPYYGKEIVIKQGDQQKGIVSDQENIYLPQNNLDKKTMIIKWYREQARAEIKPLVEYYSEQLNVDVNKIFIKEQKTRWGSCSGLKNLNFNWKIIFTKPELIRYLVIHEVCHLVHMNHSKKFWNLVETLDPNFKQNRSELTEYGVYLLGF